jgi:hypothetical protein
MLGFSVQQGGMHHVFSLRTLFVVVTLAAILAAIFTTGNPWLVSLFVGLVLLLCIWAVMERKRPFWRGFSYFGVGYIAVATAASLYPIGGLLPTSMLLVPNLTDSISTEITDEAKAVEFMDAVRTNHKQFIEVETFVVVYWFLHIACGLLIGLCAGTVCHWIARRDQSSTRG